MNKKLLKNKELNLQQKLVIDFIYNNNITLLTDAELIWLMDISEQIEYHTDDFLRIIDDDIVLTSKAKSLFSKVNLEVEKVFDEFWSVFPIKTASGRGLRAVNSHRANKAVKDYTEAKKKYLSRVTDLDTHNLAVEAVKARVASGDIEYIPGILPYINQEMWERDISYINSNKKRQNGWV